ncbi:MAG TPA: xylosidase/arabinosidase, partial [Verrucomicrobiae bacterium]|nr:xylosidase/arabinosidase [Verrucomicrobiae bacterium]
QNQIPRLKGKFLWTQYAQAKKAGATMVYQAMFDEVDEGTAIFKCTDDPPVGASTFVNYEGLPSDFYLKLVGGASRMIRGQAPLSNELPK